MDSAEFRRNLFDSLMETSAESPKQLPGERSIVGRVLVHLSKRVEPNTECRVDLDYRVADGGPKSGYWFRPNNVDAYPVEVDLIVHQRGGPNYFCAEFKSGVPTVEPDLLDQAKVLFLLGRATRNGAALTVAPSPYRLGAAISHQAERVRGGLTGEQCWTVWWYETFGHHVPTIATPDAHVDSDNGQRRAALTALNGAMKLWCAVDRWTYPDTGGLPTPPDGFPVVRSLVP